MTEARRALVPRIIVLETPPADTAAQTEGRVRETIEMIMAERQKIRNRKRKRLFVLPANGSGAQSGRSRSAPSPNGQSSVSNSKGGTGSRKRALPSTRSGKNGNGHPGDTVPPEQRLALAQGLLIRMIGEPLRERLSVTVIPNADVVAAMKGLNITAASLMGRDRRALALGRQLCGRLNASAMIIPRVVQCVVADGLTRGVRLFAHVQIVSIPDTVVLPSSGTGTGTGLKGAGLRAHRPSMIGPTQWPAELDIAGAVEVERVLFRNTFKKPQDACIRDAAVQAGNILTHALSTGEIAPFLLPEDRLAVIPVLAPTRADRLLFTVSGKRVVPMAIADLQSNVSVLFTPDVLPFTPDRILDPGAVLQELAHLGEASDEHAILRLWRADGTPDIVRVQAISSELKADYVLLTRITDIEVSQSMRVPPELATTDQLIATLSEAARRVPTQPTPQKSASTLLPDSPIGQVTSSTPYESEMWVDRTARVEATGALVRVRDGRLLWQGRANATTVTGPDLAVRPVSDNSLIRDATRFALIDIQRQLRAYQAHFER